MHFKYHDINKISMLVAKGSCSCGALFEVSGLLKKNGHTALKVRIIGQSNHPEGTTARRCIRATMRLKLGKKLQHQKAASVRTQMIEKANFVDNPSIPSETVLRKIRSESLEKDLLTVFEKIGATKFSTCAIGHNYAATINRESIWKAWSKDGGDILFIDATGSVCRKPTGAGSRRCAFYYACVTSVSGINVPISEMITVRHSTSQITSWLLCFKQHLRAVTKKAIRCVCVDESMALLKAICLAFNEMALPLYINTLHMNITMETPESNLVLIALCKAQSLRTYFKHLPKNPRARHQLLGAVKLLIAADSYLAFLQYLRKFFIVCLFSDHCACVTDAKAVLCETSLHDEPDLITENVEKDAVEDDEPFLHTVQMNLFGNDAQKIHEEVIGQLHTHECQSDTINALYVDLIII